MATLLYKTRGMVSPQGKPKVYFCCHPEDFDRFFDTVSDELLEKQNCAVWYLEDPSAVRDGDFLADLKTMQLLVMPVTSRLLRTDNAALDTEFAFAMEQHIPVLPLMQENGLDELFNRRCGDLQYLNRFADDRTAIPYDEKLSTYLSKVLIGDEEGVIPESGHERVRRYIDCGKALKADGDLDAAKGYYQQGLDLALTLAEGTDAVQARRDVLVCCEKLGDIAEGQGDLASVKGYYEKAIAVYEQLEISDLAFEDVLPVAMIEYKLGLLTREEQDLAAARAHLEKALMLFGQVKVQADTPHVRKVLETVNHLLQTTRTEQETKPKATPAAAEFPTVYSGEDATGDCEALAAAEQRMTNEQTVDSLRELCTAHHRWGASLLKSGELAKAEKQYRTAFTAWEQLANMTQQDADRRNLSVCYGMLGELALRRGDADGMLRNCEAAWVGLKRLTHGSSVREYARDRLVACLQLTRAYRLHQKTAKAFEQARTAVALAAELPTDVSDGKRLAAIAHVYFGDQLADGGINAEAAQQYQQAVCLFEEVAALANTPQANAECEAARQRLQALGVQDGENGNIVIDLPEPPIDQPADKPKRSFWKYLLDCFR